MPGSPAGPSGDISGTTSPSHCGTMEFCTGWVLGFRVEPGPRVDPWDRHPQSPNLEAPNWCAPCVPSWWTPQSWVPPTAMSWWSFHPLGVLVLGAFSTFSTEASGFSCLFPVLLPHLLQLPHRLHLPVFLVLVSRGLPVPAVTSSPPSSPLGAPGPSSIPQCPLPSFQEDSDVSLQASTCTER